MAYGLLFLASGLLVLAYRLMCFGSWAVFLAYGSWLVVITLISLHQNRPGGMRVAIESGPPFGGDVLNPLTCLVNILSVNDINMFKYSPLALRIPPADSPHLNLDTHFRPFFVFFSSQILDRFPTSFFDKNGSLLDPKMRPNVPKW